MKSSVGHGVVEGEGSIDHSICGVSRVVYDMMSGDHGEILDMLDMALDMAVHLNNFLGSAMNIVRVARKVDYATVFVRAASITLIITRYEYWGRAVGRASIRRPARFTWLAPPHVLATGIRVVRIRRTRFACRTTCQ